MAQAVECNQGHADVDRALQHINDRLAEAQARLDQNDRAGAVDSAREAEPAASLVGLNLKVLLALLQSDQLGFTPAAARCG